MENKETFKVSSKDDVLLEATSIKASERTRSHLLNDGKKFDSLEDLAKDGEKKFDRGLKNQYEIDKSYGLDINDKDSINNFNVGYTPGGRSILIKLIYEDEKIGSILIPDGHGDQRKAVVMVPGLYVNNYKKGDIIILKSQMSERGTVVSPLPPMWDRKHSNITFKEVSEDGIAGIFLDRDVWMQRIVEDNKKYGNA